MDGDSKACSFIARCEIFINTANHCLIAITTFYLMWYCFQFDSMFTTLNQHAWITTLGYQVLMAEGIMAFYNRNSLTSLSSRNEKKHIHWILQVIGSAMALYGIIIYILERHERGLTHFSSLHSMYGLVSMIFLCISLVSGLSAMFAYDVRRCIAPVISKFCHNVVSITAFITGIVSLIYLWGGNRRWAIVHDPGYLRYMSAWCLGFIGFFTCIGALKSLWFQIGGIFKLCACNSDEDDYKDTEKQ